MITKISINNFQSHKNTELELDKGVNILIGSSNSGKTAALRALYWLKDNRPSGISNASHWILENGKLNGSFNISLTKDNNLIIRERDNKYNGYILNEDYFAALKSEVPEEIKEILNLSDVNIQKQMDAPFLLSASAGEVARFFNKIVKLDIIDVMLKNVESMKRKNKNDILNIENANIELNIKLEKYNWTDEAEKLVNRLDCLNDKSDKYKNDKDNILMDIGMYNVSWIILSKTKDLDNIIELVSEIESLINMQEQRKEEKIDLEYTIDNYVYSMDDLVNSENIPEAENLIIEIEKYDKYYNIQSDFRNKLSDEIKQIKLLTTEIRFLGKEIEILEKQLPALCPVCGGKM